MAAAFAFLGSAFSVLLDRLSSPELIKFFRSRKHDEELLKKLTLTLVGLNEVLNDAEDKQYIDPAVKDWLDGLKGAFYDAEDLVDEIAYEALRSKVEAECQSCPIQVQSLISSFSKLFDDEIKSKLERMIDVLEDFMYEKAVFGLTKVGLREVIERNLSQTRLPTTSLVDESIVFGRENDKDRIMDLLLSDGESSNNIEVIPIVGMGGVGKTTLAQLLYNDHKLVNHFNVKAWVCVSDVFDIPSITRTIVEAVTERACEIKDPNLLAVKLKESLSGKKFLIVLDDVWNENYGRWDILKAPFRFGAHGSKIIVTTRNEIVASIMGTVPAHGLTELLEDDCWKLFSGIAFEKGDCSAHPDLERIGKKIVRKCNGLPLAVKTLGGLLRFKRKLKDWNNILESSMWELPVDESSILPTLRLSYYYLPSHLKRCFACCSIFFKNYEFKMDELISIWKAEGIFEKSKRNKTVEEEGCECFHELLSRSFFQKSNSNSSLFVMHYLVHDLAQYVMGDFGYRLQDDSPQHDISGKVRYFSFSQSSFCSFENFKGIKEAKCLRTFLPFKHRDDLVELSKKVLDEILPTLTSLRLLSLSRCGISELPHSIGNFIHLRFLDISYSVIKELPKSICMLYNLETFLLVSCHLLTTLPADLVKLISLRHLDLRGTNLKEMPMHIGRLKDLQQLTTFVVGKRTGIDELREFHCLQGTISISGLQNVKSAHDALEAKMGEKEHLEKLTLEWDSNIEDLQKATDVLEKLKPHTNLKHLEIQNYEGTRFPTWLGDQSFCNMVSLRLENCKNCSSLPPLGQMPSLEELTIARMPAITNVGREFYGGSGSLSKPFQSLKTLCFERMLGWVDWCILDVGEFSKLQKLEVINCPKLMGHLPSRLLSLVGLQIVDCPSLVTSLSKYTSISKLVLKECQQVELEWQGVSSVEKLWISGLASLEEFPGELATLTNLKELTVYNCFSRYKDISHYSMSLQRLTLDSCESLKILPLGSFPKLLALRILHCVNFETLLIPDKFELQNQLSLEELVIEHCDNMVSFPEGGLSAPNMSYFCVYGCKKLKALPAEMHTLLPSLHTISLWHCPNIESFPEGGLPSKLTDVYIRDCKKLVGGRRDWELQRLLSLKTFSLWGGSENVLESFPKEWLLPSALTFLTFGGLLNLKSLDARGLRRLSTLERMRISHCPQLQSLPENGIPTSLLQLEIQSCPLLTPRCLREKGEDWHKIAHIPFTKVDGEVISE